jgi:hypothetical protein
MTGALDVHVQRELRAVIAWRARHARAMQLGEALVGAILEPHPGQFIVTPALPGVADRERCPTVEGGVQCRLHRNHTMWKRAHEFVGRDRC